MAMSIAWTKNPAATWAGVIGAPFKSNVPLLAAGSVVILTALRLLLAGTSLNWKSAILKAYATSSWAVTALSMPTGAALAVPLTLIVMILGAGSVSTPPLRTPPSSRTWKVNVA